jgi:hypothetical protein
LDPAINWFAAYWQLMYSDMQDFEIYYLYPKKSPDFTPENFYTGILALEDTNKLPLKAKSKIESLKIAKLFIDDANRKTFWINAMNAEITNDLDSAIMAIDAFVNVSKPTDAELFKLLVLICSLTDNNDNEANLTRINKLIAKINFSSSAQPIELIVGYALKHLSIYILIEKFSLDKREEIIQIMKEACSKIQSDELNEFCEEKINYLSTNKQPAPPVISNTILRPFLTICIQQYIHLFQTEEFGTEYIGIESSSTAISRHLEDESLQLKIPDIRSRTILSSPFLLQSYRLFNFSIPRFVLEYDSNEGTQKAKHQLIAN